MRRIAIALVALAGLAPAASAQDLLDSYSAYLSADDHYNSNGERLTEAWQIIRQDRANFHRFGRRDPEDQNDSFFASAENRAIAERMLRDGYTEPGFKQYVVNNEVMVRVHIYGYGNTGTYINVTAY